MSTNIAPIVGMSNEQAGRVADRFQTFCRKEGAVLPRETVQAVLEEEGDQLSADMFTALRVRVERRAKMIVRRVRVDRNRTHKEAIEATGRKRYVDSDVLATAPKGEGEEVDVYFFDLDYDPTVDELDREMEIRGLRPDVDALTEVNQADPAFADDRPNVTQWRDVNGKACYAVFHRWRGERGVGVDRDGGGWGRCCRFAGVRK